ncbi:fused MFS/spermidine synthase [Pseudoxanthomonas mexicana]|uniref:Fused MFS/spermidine synthase n=1 Tax=Pseudoxanthomonas mexicana TaxID=128785 RepID=A0ABX6RF57_PSEMX|nr:fused MFS/spermidine synthase [Pseudoxanthomonas mexicana]QND81903.1 fused MFS/spermidine synthase [Pseudoxanthomonas mexicana]
MRNALLGRALIGLFIVSGFAGLIYQSIWSHYLGLVLGHAAYAQTLVLGIFMGGMALGAWLASRRSTGWRNLILAYGIIELIIGVVGLVFHPLFVGYVDFSQQTVLPALSSPGLAHAYQWISGALLMVPQSVLLGMTFPILSAGYLRLAPNRAGEVLGGLYFSNSLGAAFGALATAFLLLPALGMPGTMMTAGILNIVVGIGAWVVWKLVTADPVPASSGETTSELPSEPSAELPRLAKVVLVASFVTGSTSFIYEIGWVRLLNQALGTTIHSFELMLAAFILGLAFGGWWVRRKAASIKDAIRYAAYAQVFMGLAALVSVVALAKSFHWVGWLMQSLARTDSGYTLFSGGSAIVSLLVMFPAAFFAGMTLPLFTLALLRNGGGEQQIGRVYAANTLGAIVGVLAMVHLLIPLMGVRLSLILAALADAALGLYLMRYVSPGVRTLGYALAGLATLAFTAFATIWGKHDPRVLAAGVFRTARAVVADGVQVPYLRDGKTATITASVGGDGTINISTNGKPDASLAPTLKQKPTGDEITMIMAGALPLVMHPDPKEVAVIGWGSGLTTHTLLGSPLPERVDTIEIEKGMYDGARVFGDRVKRAYEDPRSKLHVDDARTYFSMGNRKFDVIVSEPSNPWVSGVASLFTEEFYSFMRGHLKPGGMVVQWVQAYELNDELLATMVAALLEVFPDSELYVTNGGDLLILARTAEAVAPNWAALTVPDLSQELPRVGLGSPEQFALRRVGGPALLRNFVRTARAQPHSDFYPVVSLNAPRSRFKGETATSLLSIIDNGVPISEMLEKRVEVPAQLSQYDVHSRFAQSKRTALAIRESLLNGGANVEEYGDDPSLLPQTMSLLRQSESRVKDSEVLLWTRLVASVSQGSLSQLVSSEQQGVWSDPAWISRDEQPQAVLDVLDALDATADRDAGRMYASAMKVLDYPDEVVSVFLKEQMFIQAMVGALASGHPDRALALDKDRGGRVMISSRFNYAHAFLNTWATTLQQSPGQKD